jgi:hypothetical protein
MTPTEMVAAPDVAPCHDAGKPPKEGVDRRTVDADIWTPPLPTMLSTVFNVQSSGKTPMATIPFAEGFKVEYSTRA